MQPQQSYPPEPSNGGTDPYGFIMQYGHPKLGHTSGSTSPVGRLLIVAGGAALLLIIGFIFIAQLSKPSDRSTPLLVSAAQQETEMARIAGEGLQDARTQQTVDFAATAQLSLESDQQTLVGFLKAAGKAPSAKVLGGTQSGATDTKLSTAKTDGTYDQVFTSIMQSDLTAYEQTLRQAVTVTPSAKEKQWLGTAYAHAQSLIQMSSQTE